MTTLRIIALLLVLVGSASARADTLTLRGSSIPLRGCTIQDVKSGRVYYLDARGRRQWREIEEVDTIGFDGLEALDAAEALLAEAPSPDGVRQLLRALLEADADLERLWVRVRLVQVHERRDEHVQAAGHAAVVFRLRDEASWRGLAPIGGAESASFPALHEALLEIEASSRSVRSGDLREQLRRMRAMIEPAHDRARAAWQEPVPGPGDTLSGIPVEQLRAPAKVETGAPEPAPEPTAAPPQPAVERPEAAPATPPRPDPASKPAPRRSPSSAAADASERIDRLLEEGRAAEALALCKRLAADPGQAHVSQLLFQYGRCLAAAGHPRDAVVMYLRCAILHESSAFAPPSLIEAARIHRDVWGDTAAARRLLDRAIRAATLLGRADDVGEAERLLRTVPAADGDP
jgi:hypothetical protein